MAPTPEVPWFPTNLEELNRIGKNTLIEGAGFDAIDHPTFTDPIYKARRHQIGDLALNYNLGDKEIPFLEYNSDEKGVWKICYEKLSEMYTKVACKEYNDCLADMQ